MRGPLPDWAADAGPRDVPYVVSADGNLVGVLFGAPLHVGDDPSGRTNKILWIVREPRNGAPLRLTARPTGSGDGPPVTVTRPADSSPGEIYPSTVDVPTAGCWRVDAEWNGHHATVDLRYTA